MQELHLSESEGYCCADCEWERPSSQRLAIQEQGSGQPAGKSAMGRSHNGLGVRFQKGPCAVAACRAGMRSGPFVLSSLQDATCLLHPQTNTLLFVGKEVKQKLKFSVTVRSAAIITDVLKAFMDTSSKI